MNKITNKKLWEVTVQFTIVVAANHIKNAKKIAEDCASKYSGIGPIKTNAQLITDFTGVPENWLNCLPFACEHDLRTCKEWFEE